MNGFVLIRSRSYRNHDQYRGFLALGCPLFSVLERYWLTLYNKYIALIKRYRNLCANLTGRGTACCARSISYLRRIELVALAHF